MGASHRGCAPLEGKDGQRVLRGINGSSVVGDRLDVTVHQLGLTIIEPVEVTDVVIEHDCVGFAYRTRPGHPISGEEAFIVHREGDAVHFTVRSLTRAASQQPWRTLYPVLLIAQRIVRRRYLRALH